MGFSKATVEYLSTEYPAGDNLYQSKYLEKRL